MKKQTVFALLAVLALALSSCGTTPPAAPTTPTLLPTQQTVIPTNIIYPTFTSTPLATAISYPTVTPLPTEIPYPTASVVNANAVAFISGNSLWVANVDGSGEKKLTDFIQKNSLESVQMQWSPNGEWISYRSDDGLWMISRDGLAKKKLLSFPDTSGRYLSRYAWSPDSSKVAFLEFLCGNSTVTPTPGPDMGIAPYLVGMIDITTGNVSELFSFGANAGIPALFWSPNGRSLFFIKDFSFVLFDIATGKVVKEMKRGCGIEKNMSLSPNGQWYSYTDNGVGVYWAQWICVGGLDVVPYRIDADGTTSVPKWDKTGNFLYFFASDFSVTPLPDYDLRLMRYNVITQELERVLSLGKEPYERFVSISPDGRTLQLYKEYPDQNVLVFVDIQSLQVHELKVGLDFSAFIGGIAWASDNRSVIFHSTDRFYSVDSQTGKVIIISGKHSVEIYRWAVSPVATTP